jgi:hypothetical protein
MTSAARCIRFTQAPSFIDWNQLNMDELADNLESEFGYQSSGTAFAVMKMVDFYRKSKGTPD